MHGRKRGSTPFHYATKKVDILYTNSIRIALRPRRMENATYLLIINKTGRFCEIVSASL